MALTPKPKQASPQQKPRFTLIELLPKARARAGCLRNIYYILCARHAAPSSRSMSSYASLLCLLAHLGGGAPVRCRSSVSSVVHPGTTEDKYYIRKRAGRRGMPLRKAIHLFARDNIIRCMHTQRSCHLPHTGVAMLAT